MPAVTALQIITDAFADREIFQPGDLIDAASAQDALRRLNLMIGQWANQSLTIPAVSRLGPFPLLANKGSATNPYTIGIGGDLNVPRPTFQNSVVGAGLLYGTPAPPFDLEIPRGVATNSGWALERLKDLPSSIFTYIYYRPDYAGDLGAIFLWPVPTDLTNFLILYVEQAISTFADLTTSYTVPPGYDDALHFNLALRLIGYGRPTTQDLKDLAKDSFLVIQRANVKLVDVANDFAAIGGHGSPGVYNIETGED